jgi:hypothetical protein
MPIARCSRWRARVRRARARAYRLADESAALHSFRVAAGSTRWCRGGRDPRPGRDAFEAGRRARCSAGLPDGAPGRPPAHGSRPRSARARRRSPRPRARSRSRCSTGSSGAVSCSSGRPHERADGAKPSLARATISVVANRTLEHASRLAEALGARPARIDGSPALEARRRRLLDERPRLRPHGRRARAGASRAPRRADPDRRPRRAARRRPLAATIDGCFLYDVDALEGVVARDARGPPSEAVTRSGSCPRRPSGSAPGAPRSRSCRRSPRLRAHAEEITAASSRGSRAARPRRRDLVDTLTAQIVNKLLHLPTVRSRRRPSRRTGCSMLTSCATCSGWRGGRA